MLPTRSVPRSPGAIHHTTLTSQNMLSYAAPLLFPSAVQQHERVLMLTRLNNVDTVGKFFKMLALRELSSEISQAFERPYEIHFKGGGLIYTVAVEDLMHHSNSPVSHKGLTLGVVLDAQTLQPSQEEYLKQILRNQQIQELLFITQGE